MLDSEWAQFRHFSKNENWGNPYLIKKDLLVNLQKLRDLINCPFIVTSGTGGAHSANSYHYEGLAVDVVIVGSSYHPLDILILALQAGFSGIGHYPSWEVENRLEGGSGFHFDVGDRKATWLGIRDKRDSLMTYVPFSWENLKKYDLL